MLVAWINAVKVESVPLNFIYFRLDHAHCHWQMPEKTRQSAFGPGDGLATVSYVGVCTSDFQPILR